MGSGSKNGPYVDPERPLIRPIVPFLSVPSTAILGSVPDREIVLGLIGKFWKLRDGGRVAVQSREQFMAFNTSGFALSTLSFHVEARGPWITRDDHHARADHRSGLGHR